MPFEIQIHALAKSVTTQKCRHHPNDLGALFIHSGRVEIVDFAIAFRPDRMRCRASVFGELSRTQQADIIRTLYTFIMRICRKALIAEYCQTLFQRQLEPVATSDTITCPIMEIFMRHNRFNTVQVGIRCRIHIGQHKFAVKDIQTLIFHRTHIEMADRDDLEQIKVIFQTKAFLIPFHRTLQ